MATKEEAYAAYKKINPNKEPSQTDLDNGMKFGTDIYAQSYAKITGKPTTQTATARQQGQAVVPTTAQGRYDQAQQELSNLVDNKGKSAEFLKQLLELKAEQKAPILKEKKQIRNKIAKMDIADKAYKNLRPEDATVALGEDISMELNNLQYLSEQLQNQQANTQSTLDSLNEYMQNRGALLSDQMQQAGAEISASARGGGGGGGYGAKPKAATGFDADLASIAQDIIEQENALGAGIGEEAYWGIVNLFAKDKGLSPEQADTMVIRKIQELKKQPVTGPNRPQMQQQDDNPGSDFFSGVGDFFNKVYETRPWGDRKDRSYKGFGDTEVKPWQ